MDMTRVPTSFLQPHFGAFWFPEPGARNKKDQEPIHIQFADKAFEVDPVISLLSLLTWKVITISSRAKKKVKTMPVLSCRSYPFSLFSLSYYCVQLDFLVTVISWLKPQTLLLYLFKDPNDTHT